LQLILILVLFALGIGVCLVLIRLLIADVAQNVGASTATGLGRVTTAFSAAVLQSIFEDVTIRTSTGWIW